ncbi:hypothetical protein CLOM_g3892 [Closterium sp. NIES-68]|nr:hypothetical protein CLOM_g3892 [Closterium sp. NIES-68]GJP66822.1 hypothetical protein CLOP_g23716 [Closterium sp. NIES-67]
MARKSSARNWRDSATSPHSPSASLLLSTSALALSILAGAWLVPRQLWGADLTSNPLTCIKSTCALLLPVSLLLFSHPPFHSSLSLQPSPSPGRATPEQLIPRIATAIGLSYCGEVPWLQLSLPRPLALPVPFSPSLSPSIGPPCSLYSSYCHPRFSLAPTHIFGGLCYCVLAPFHCQKHVW